MIISCDFGWKSEYNFHLC